MKTVVAQGGKTVTQGLLGLTLPLEYLSKLVYSISKALPDLAHNFTSFPSHLYSLSSKWTGLFVAHTHRSPSHSGPLPRYCLCLDCFPLLFTRLTLPTQPSTLSSSDTSFWSSPSPFWWLGHNPIYTVASPWPLSSTNYSSNFVYICSI